MVIPTCSNWFNEVSNAEVPKRTCHTVLLFVDNYPGHFEGFQKENAVVRVFTPNVTSWKQPCNWGVIPAVKKRYKFLLLKDVLSFYQLDNNQQLLKEEGSKFCRVSIGVRYGRPVTLLDAVNYAKKECDKVTDETIKNSFIKADFRISLDSAVTETFENNEFLKNFKNVNITATY